MQDINGYYTPFIPHVLGYTGDSGELMCPWLLETQVSSCVLGYWRLRSTHVYLATGDSGELMCPWLMENQVSSCVLGYWRLRSAHVSFMQDINGYYTSFIPHVLGYWRLRSAHVSLATGDSCQLMCPWLLETQVSSCVLCF